MMADKYLSNEAGTRFVKLGRIREFTIREKGHERWTIIAWINDSDMFDVKAFKTREEAQTYLNIYLE